MGAHHGEPALTSRPRRHKIWLGFPTLVHRAIRGTAAAQNLAPVPPSEEELPVATPLNMPEGRPKHIVTGENHQAAPVLTAWQNQVKSV